MMAENLSPQAIAASQHASEWDESHPLTMDAFKGFLHTHNALPPAAALHTLGADDLSRLVASGEYSSFLAALWPAAFGAPHAHAVRARAAPTRRTPNLACALR